MAVRSVLQQTVETAGGSEWTLEAHELSERDHPAYAPLLPTPAPGLFLTVTDATGQVRGYERVGDMATLSARVAAITSAIGALD